LSDHESDVCYSAHDYGRIVQNIDKVLAFNASLFAAPVATLLVTAGIVYLMNVLRSSSEELLSAFKNSDNILKLFLYLSLGILYDNEGFGYSEIVIG